MYNMAKLKVSYFSGMKVNIIILFRYEIVFVSDNCYVGQYRGKSFKISLSRYLFVV